MRMVTEPAIKLYFSIIFGCLVSTNYNMFVTKTRAKQNWNVFLLQGAKCGNSY
ncbi:hypothetical protein SAMN04488023_104243 [Pedobacter rhizosphaerae]|uniref:Uncharacterized protein n=1 Tax=Pedobacter rhizosphaerae TaxID=390241 RepID=A0A1H9LPW8_9SPHI|nr:hypothetical protein SAMN04488023_104243 [Pedobacter rhizosphaerae]